MSIWQKNLKYLRAQKKLSQAELAEKIGMSRSSVSAIENGKFQPGFDVLKKLSELFDVSIDSLIKVNLASSFLDKEQKNNLRILTVSVDKSNNEKIDFIPEKAQAGYLSGYKDPEFIRELSKFSFPMRIYGTFRAFEISGDSMLPIADGSIVVGRYLENLQQVQASNRYIIVTKSKGIVFKRISNNIMNDHLLICSSDNAIYEPFKLEIEDILELWQFYAFIGFDSIYANNPIGLIQNSIERIEKKLIDKN